MNLESLFSLKGKNAIVVGGSKGIGNAMAKGLAAAGADVVLVSRKQAELDSAAVKMAEETGANVVGIAADVSTVDGCRELVDKVVAANSKRVAIARADPHREVGICHLDTRSHSSGTSVNRVEAVGTHIVDEA